MSSLLRLDSRVAVVTGAGNGLGKLYAYLFAERGASVVVNDLGCDYLGEGNIGTSAANEVVSSIISKGGKAVANYDSVTDGEKIVKTALDTFGRIDILVNNAGILRPRTFAKMAEKDWHLVTDVHLNGAFKTTRAAWDAFKSQNYGRIVHASSPVAIFGNFGNANYAAAKAALIGFSATLAQEGARFNIHSNCILPMAKTRMTENTFEPYIIDPFKPELIAAIVAWMCHEDCSDSGMVIEACGGYSKRYQWIASQGAVLRSSKSDAVTIEKVKENWNKIIDMRNPRTPKTITEVFEEYAEFFKQTENK